MLLNRIFLALLSLGSATVLGANFITTNALSQSSEQMLENESWIFSEQSINLAGGAKDDLFLYAQTNIELDGNFGNDIWAVAGNEISLNGSTADHLRLVAGKSIVIDGKIQNNCIAISPAGTVFFGPESELSGNALLNGRSVIFKGVCDGDINTTGYTCSIGGHIKGDLIINSPEIVILPGTIIDGDLHYMSASELFLAPSVTLSGTLKREIIKKSGMTKTSMLLTLFFYIGAIISGAVLMRLFPASCGTAARLVSASRWRCMLLGFASFFVIPVLLYALFVSGIGIPLMLLLSCSYGLLLYVGKLVTAFWIGGMLLRLKVATSYGQAFSALAVGITVLYLAALIPGFGGAVWIVSTSTGLGALLSIIFTRQRILPLPTSGATPAEVKSKE